MNDEQDLIYGLKRNNYGAFNQVYRLYAGRLLNFCRVHLDCEEDAEEVVQDVFVALWNSRKNIRSENSLKSLLFTSARNRILNKYRSRINLECGLDSVRDSDYATVVTGSTDLEYKEFRRKVISAVMKLPPAQRRILIMSRYRDMSHKEISERLGYSIQTVKNNLSIALHNLRKILDGGIFMVLLSIMMLGVVLFNKFGVIMIMETGLAISKIHHL